MNPGVQHVYHFGHIIREHGPSIRPINTDSVYRAPVSTDRVGKKHCTTILVQHSPMTLVLATHYPCSWAVDKARRQHGP